MTNRGFCWLTMSHWTCCIWEVKPMIHESEEIKEFTGINENLAIQQKWGLILHVGIHRQRSMDVGLSERVEYRRVRPCKVFGDIKVWPVFLVVSSSDFALDFAQKKVCDPHSFGSTGSQVWKSVKQSGKWKWYAVNLFRDHCDFLHQNLNPSHL